jgi:CheY-like chemotaxis protein
MSNKILVIDDNDEVRDMLHDLLKFKGYDVETAETGTAGLEKLTQVTPDLIICDIAMPEKDGFQVLEEVRSTPEHSDVPFIFLTASMIRSEEEQIIKTSANGYLMKPYESHKLFTLLDTLLTTKEQKDKEKAETKEE